MSVWCHIIINMVDNDDTRFYEYNFFLSHQTRSKVSKLTSPFSSKNDCKKAVITVVLQRQIFK